ncbi:carboxylating nicotinate-nucleotide diphosphorylase [Agaribacterium haliotis]|uniref:carboxylating nicotinate-nucleotide diphosphorylase n=1 Tax=Agaribacterium haliotis TaxID=2013869 RepID=UPI000BB599AE|nr:carboxylating nicotinate-nucleotide diphosphorylase [Agaribacterium haliotis]
MNLSLNDIREDIERGVRQALDEDLGSGDISAKLIPEDSVKSAYIITREDCVLCGSAWLDETFKQLGGLDSITWHARDGEFVKAGGKLVSLKGKARTLLSGERVALNFIQLLSAVASKAKQYKDTLGESKITLLDTRKTLPGLRLAQKYAVSCGGLSNHRIGLYDMFMLKENHIAACGDIRAAVNKAREIAPGKKVEVETENLDELKQAISAGADVAMLDNFSEAMLKEAFTLERGKTKFELSGDLSLEALTKARNLPVDYCSFGDLTKNVRAVDLSMRVEK